MVATKPKTIAGEPALGDEVIDSIENFRGIVVGTVQFISGCDQLLVQPPIGEDGKRITGYWIDIDRIKIIKRAVHQRAKVDRVGADGQAPIK